MSSKLAHFRPYLLNVIVMVALVTCSPLNLSDGVALLIVDVQNCFMDPNSPLHVANGSNVIPAVNDVRGRHGDALSCVVLIQDLHCENHVAFASQHPRKNEFDELTLQYGEDGTLCSQTNLTSPHARPCDHVAHQVTQILWPDHCIVGEPEADFAAGLIRHEEDIVIKTGNNCQVDTYSAFKDSGGFIDTGLHAVLRRHGVRTVLVTGVALQYSIYYTLLDSVLYGYNTYLVMDATAGASDSDVETTEQKLKELKEKGVQVVNIADLDNMVFKSLRQTSGTSQTIHKGYTSHLITIAVVSMLVIKIQTSLDVNC